MITHEDEVAAHADRLVRLADGRVVRDVSLNLAAATEAVGARRPVGVGLMAFETLRTAWVGLMSHRMRTALTVLGITIGIASVIVLIAVGKGSSDAVQESIDELGSEHPDRQRHGAPAKRRAARRSGRHPRKVRRRSARRRRTGACDQERLASSVGQRHRTRLRLGRPPNRANSSAPRRPTSKPTTTPSNRAPSSPRRR